jgi:hypothetical protein
MLTGTFPFWANYTSDTPECNEKETKNEIK